MRATRMSIYVNVCVPTPHLTKRIEKLILLFLAVPSENVQTCVGVFEYKHAFIITS